MEFFKPSRIYLDNASSTLPCAEALEAMREAEGLIGNPGAIHAEGVAAKAALESARAALAFELSAKSREIVFTSGLTESINLAVLGAARHVARRRLGLGLGDALAKTHWVVSAIEHVAVLEAFSEIEKNGGTVTHIMPDVYGIISPAQVREVIRPETVLVSIGWGNNEVGVVQPIRDISRAIKAVNAEVLLHVDAGQAPLYLSPQVHTLGIDLFSLGSNKVYGPHGIGALYVRGDVKVSSLVVGGSQERAMRAGTENVALAAGFAAAFQSMARIRADESRRLTTLRDAFVHDLISQIPNAVINGDIERALPHIINISIPRIQSEYMTLALDRVGVSISTKSACKEGEERRSHVVDAMYVDVESENWRAAHTLRFSLGRETTSEDLTVVVRALRVVLSTTFSHS